MQFLTFGFHVWSLVAICVFYVVLDKGGIHRAFQKRFKPFSIVKLAINVV